MYRIIIIVIIYEGYDMNRTKTTEQFIQEAKEIHGELYTYENAVYINAYTKVAVTCKIHGDFLVTPTAHRKLKHGCRQCSIAKRASTTESFVKQASEVHDNFYDYAKTVYTTAHNRVTITCPVHGDFEQQAYVHIQGHKCPACGKDICRQKMKDRPDTWSYRGWKTAGELSSTFEGYSLYIISCQSETENFIKIGKTFMNISRRFSKILPYSWVLQKQVFGSADFISRLEEELHKEYKLYSYTPSQPFHGANECYQLNLEDLLHAVNQRTTDYS